MTDGIRGATLLSTLTLFLAGCTGTPQIPFDSTSSQPIKVIGVLTPFMAKEPSVVRATSLGQSFGLTGALVEQGLENDRESKFSRMISPLHFSGRDAFLTKLHRELQARGYQVVDLKMRRDDSNYLDHYPDPALYKSPIDAYLDVVVTGYGYLCAGMSKETPYRPSFSIQARMVRSKGGAVVVEDSIAYNVINPEKGMVTIAPDPAYTFVDSDTLSADPRKAVEGMQASIDAVTHTLGTLIK